jgi:NTE family protein
MTSRAVVLGGGGPVGIAWECGLAAGLAARGVELAAAELIAGTSAGSVVGAHLALGLDLDALVTGVGASPRLAGGGADPGGSPQAGDRRRDRGG